MNFLQSDERGPCEVCSSFCPGGLRKVGAFSDLLSFLMPYAFIFQASADPGLCQGRGGAWDHRRCGTWLSGRKQRHTPSRQRLCQLHAPAIYMLLPNSYTYMPLPSVFQEVQDCRLPGLKPSKRFRRPPRQQLLQLLHAQQLLQLLHAPAICFSGGSRLPFARPQTPQTLPTLPQASKATTLTATCPCHLFFRGFKTAVCPPQTPQTLPTLPQASKATTLTATTCPCHLFFRGFKTAVCPPSNPPNASNPSAGLQGNNSYSYMPLPSVFQGVQDCRLPALKPPKPFRRPPRQQLLQLHAPAICFSGGSRLPFARPQSPKRFQPSRRPPRQQLLRLHAPAICFSGGSRLPFARPQTPQTLPTLPQASKATTLTATCPCHLFFRGFKTAVCPPSNPPNASNPSAGLQGNNSYSYMPLPSVFQGVQDCCLPALNPPKRFQPSRRPPRQQLLQLHAPAICFSGGSRLPFARPQTPQTLPTLLAGLQGNNSYSYMPLPSVFQGVQDCRLPALKPPRHFRKGNNSYSYMSLPSVFQRVQQLPFDRPQTPQTLPTLPQASKATTLTATCPCHLFFRGFKTAVCPASNPPNASAGLQGNNSYSYYMPLPSVFQGVQDCRLPALKPPKRFQPSRRPPRQQLLQLHAPAICFSGGSRLPFARPQTPQTLPTLPQASKATTLTRQQLLQLLHAPAICFSGGSRLPFACPQTPQTLPTLPQASKATTLTATCPCHLFFRGFKTGLQGNNSYSYMPLPSVFQGVQDCRLPALKPPKPFRRPPRQQLLQLHVPAICFSGGSRLPFARPQTPQTLPQASKATTLTATCPCHLFFRGFKTAVCPPSNPPNASNPSAGLQGNNSYSYMPLPSVFQGVQDCRLPALNPPKRFQPSRRPPRQQLLSYSYYMPLPSVFQGVQDCRLPGLKPPKRFQPSRRPPRQQLLQLHAPAICFSGGSRLPFARPQTPQTLPQASKATTLTATCPCHLFFRGFKTAVCPPSIPPNASAGLQGNTLTATCPCHLFFRGFKTAVCPPSNPPNASNPLAGLQGNNSYSYMPLPSVFQGVQDCRLPALKPPKHFQPSRRPARQQL